MGCPLLALLALLPLFAWSGPWEDIGRELLQLESELSPSRNAVMYGKRDGQILIGIDAGALNSKPSPYLDKVITKGSEIFLDCKEVSTLQCLDCDTLGPTLHGRRVAKARLEIDDEATSMKRMWHLRLLDAPDAPVQGLAIAVCKTAIKKWEEKETQIKIERVACYPDTMSKEEPFAKLEVHPAEGELKNILPNDQKVLAENMKIISYPTGYSV